MSRAVLIVGLVLVVSLAFNLFLAGGMLGIMFHHRPPSGPELIDRRLNAIWQKMPEPDQAIARKVIEQHRGDIMEKWRAMRDGNQQAGLALRAGHFESDEARSALARANQRAQDYRSALQDTMIETAGKISPEGRELLQPFAQ